ncbi:cell division ATP-binding protein FtsE [Candidatus Odyssella acanthamoebae]|uniref:Cell division ATP-binding protein FtsE n=1 Tax=Candidatus Odyssella acanthamoebae TaxID=91604 RepID=A0A077AUG3_9PROT|nr:ATP-binding cassette domain-containing protein [Candidatus Paracaedibacter acanthamoebae]AIK96006.1 cell division protein FtsE [Candidatus Paracaedibacter acanthamoebae]
MVIQRRQPIEIVRFDQVGLVYPGGHRVLHGLSQSFNVGSFTFLTGVSGAGKTSLLKLMYRGVRSTEGTVRVFSKDVNRITNTELPQYRQRIGIVFQDCKLFSHLNVIDNVALALKVSGTDVKTARTHAKELLQWVGLGQHLYEMPYTLSDGQKQRVAIARAVITRPLLLLADEPTGNLDHESGYRLLRLFEELNKIGTTVILATHNKALIAEFPYPEVELHQGRLISVSNQSTKVSHG